MKLLSCINQLLPNKRYVGKGKKALDIKRLYGTSKGFEDSMKILTATVHIKNRSERECAEQNS